MSEHIKFSKNTEWLRPFIVASGKYVPIEKLRKVHGFRVAKGLEEQVDGSILKWNGKFSINLRMQNLKEDKKKYQNVRYEALLVVLAHELAHMLEWEHTPEHFRLMTQIMRRFVRVLRNLPVEDTSLMWDKRLKRNKDSA